MLFIIHDHSIIIHLLYSCNVGDYVLVVWESSNKNYVIYQENKRNLVFLHPDSIDSLSLRLGSGEFYTLILTGLQFNILLNITFTCTV